MPTKEKEPSLPRTGNAMVDALRAAKLAALAALIKATR